MNYQQPIYIIATDHRTGKNVAKEIALADYLREYCSDETTTPKGVAPRLHIRESEDAGTFEVWTWGPGGQHPRKLDTFQAEEEAAKDILNAWYQAWCVGKHSASEPPHFDTLEELFQNAAENGEAVLTEKENEVVLAQMEADQKRREKARAAKYDALLGDHKAVLLEWWKSREYHPAPKAVMQAKEQTGMTWKEIRNYCKANAQF